MSALDERDASLLRDMNENANKAIRFMKDRSREDLDSDDLNWLMRFFTLLSYLVKRRVAFQRYYDQHILKLTGQA